MPIAKTFDDYTVPTYQQPTTTTTPPPGGNTGGGTGGGGTGTGGGGTGGNTGGNTGGGGNTQVYPPPPPTIQSNSIVTRVSTITRKQRPATIGAGSLTATKSSPSINGRTFKRFAISFDDAGEKNLDIIRVWVKGYLTGGALASGVDPDNLPWRLMQQAKSSPVYMDLEASSENIVIGVEMVNAQGHGLLNIDEMEHLLTDTT